MKKMIFVVAFAAISMALVTVSCNKNKQEIANKENNSIKERPVYTGEGTFLSINMLRPRTGCSSGCGLCGGHLVILGWELAGPHMVSAKAIITTDGDGNKRLNIYFNGDTYPLDSTFEVGEAVDLEPEVCNALGYETIHLNEGDYSKDLDEEGNALVSVDIVTN